MSSTAAYRHLPGEFRQVLPPTDAPAERPHKPRKAARRPQQNLGRLVGICPNGHALTAGRPECAICNH